MSCIINRYALLLVFEYKRVHNNIDAPKELYSMITDLKLAYDLCINKFNIPNKNITIITDIKSKDYPWLPRKCDNCNPNVKIIDHPDISFITKNIAQFVENTIRGIDETNKGEDNNNEVFIYISGHGYQILNYEYNKCINTLQLTNEKGNKSYFLKNNEIFELLFGRVEIDNDGSMLIPYMHRDIKINKEGKMYYHYYNDTIKINITPLSKERSHHDDDIVTGCSPKLYNNLRGLPGDTQMLMIIDTCHSGKMANFHYVYDPKENIMEVTHTLPNSIATFPLCICLSATEEHDTTLSTTKGSPFTRYIYNIFQNIVKPITIPELYKIIYEKMPDYIKFSKPSITSTSSHVDKYIPLLENYNKNPICKCKYCNELNICNC